MAPEPLPALSTGYKRYVYVVLLFVTWIFWNVAVFHCNFVKIKFDNRRSLQSFSFGDDDVWDNIGDDDAWDNMPMDWSDYDVASGFSANFEVGLFTASQGDTCAPYPDGTDFDGATKAGQFFGAMGFIFDTLALGIVACLELCILWRAKLLWTVAQGLLLSAFVSSLLMFSVYASDNCKDDGIKCVPGGAGIAHIFNILFLVVAMVLSGLTSPPRHPFLFCSRWIEEDVGMPEQGNDDDLEKNKVVATVDVTATEQMEEAATPVQNEPVKQMEEEPIDEEPSDKEKPKEEKEAPLTPEQPSRQTVEEPREEEDMNMFDV